MEAVREAAELINNAKKPLALVGQGVELGHAQEELKTFLEKADIPAGRTMLGLSALPSDHPLNVGMLGMHGNYAVNLKEQECDVLIAIGMRFSDRVTGNTKTYAKQAKIIHLDIDRSEIDKNVKTDVAVVADCKESLPAITALLNKNRHTEWRDSFKELDVKERTKVIEPAIHPTEGPLLMGEVVNAVAEKAPKGTVLVTDVGQNQLFATRYFKYPEKRSICTSGGLGTMGYGMPAAIGATFATDRMVVCFMGDGGFQMNIQELGTIMEQQAPVKMILLNNNYLGNVRQWQDMFWMRRKSFTKMLNPCYEQIAKGYGIAYEAVTDRANLAAAVEKMLTTKGPYILECAIKEDDDVLPMTPPGMNVNDMMLEV
jgi:acetolactate synthase-1/2/3 large subunit